MIRLLFFSLFSFLILNSPSALAFKVGTHVWVGQQVLNNIQSCTESNAQKPCIFIEIDDQKLPISISSEVASALLQYPEAFRMGHIGPDAYPGILEGQLVVHPGITTTQGKRVTKSGFGTGEWLEHILKAARAQTDPKKRAEFLAFAYGFLGHASGDIFAHTYVNLYAGDIFSLTDGEQEVESRHFALESFIDQLKPEFTDHRGRNLGTASQLISKGGKLAVPAEAVRDTFFYASAARKQFEKTNFKHIQMINGLRDGLRALLCKKESNLDFKDLAKRVANGYIQGGKSDRKAFEDMSLDALQDDIKQYVVPSSGCVFQEIDMIVVQILSAYYLDLGLSKQEAAAVLEIKGKIDGFIAEKGEKILKVKHKIEDLNEKALKLENRLAQAHYKALRQSIEVFDGAMEKLEDAVEEKQNAEKQVLDIHNRILSKFTKFNCKALNWTCPDEDFTDTVTDIISYTCKKPKFVNVIEDKVTQVPCKLNKPAQVACKKTKKTCRRVTKFLGKLGKAVCNVVEYSAMCPVVKQVDSFCPKVVKATRVDRILENAICKKKNVRKVVDFHAKQQCLAAQASCESMELAFKAQKKALEAQLAAKQKLEKAAIKLVQDAAGEADRAVQGLAKAHQGITDFHVATLNMIQAQETLTFEMAMRLQEGIYGIFNGWLQDIDTSMAAYVTANGQAIFNSMNSEDRNHVYEPLMNWVNCYAPMIIGVPGPVAEGSFCMAKNVQDEIQKLSETIDAAVLKFLPKVVEQIHNKVQHLVTKVLPEAAADALSSELEKVGGGDEFDNLAHLFQDSFTDKELDEAFRSGDGGKNLLIFNKPDQMMSHRARKDMAIRGGKLDAKRFAPLANAVTLASLSLLDAEGLNQLLASQGVGPLYSASSNNNILTQAVQSIDGNHQWMKVAPPYPRQDTYQSDTLWSDSSSNGSNIARRYSMQETAATPSFGFKIFLNEAARQAVFEKIFRAPIAASLSLDSTFDAILPADYPFTVNANDPFGIFEN